LKFNPSLKIAQNVVCCEKAIGLESGGQNGRVWPGLKTSLMTHSGNGHLGIGASFDTPERDVQIAQAGFAALPHGM
jgi:hypothetical protein